MTLQTVLSGWELTWYCEKLNERLGGARVQDCLLCRSGDVALQVRVPGETLYLRLGCDHDAQWFFAATRKPPVSRAGSPLRDKLGTLLGGARVQRCGVVAGRRIARVGFVRGDELLYLVHHVPLPDRAIALVDADGRVQVQAGILRQARTDDTFNWPEPLAAAGELDAATVLAADQPERALARWQPGLTGPLAQRMLALARAAQEPAAKLTALVQQVDAGPRQPVVVCDAAGEAQAVLPDADLLLPEEKQRAESFARYDEAVERFWQSRLVAIERDRLRKELRSQLQRLCKRTRRTRRQVEQEHQAHETNLAERGRGDLLAANFHRLRRGKEALDVEDFTQSGNPVVTIPLDPQKSPQENVEAYYRLAQRAERGLDRARARLAELDADADRLEQTLDHVEREPRLDVLRDLARRYNLDPDTPRHTGSPKATKQRRLPAGVSLLLAPSGHEVYLGRNARANDEVLRRYTRGNDLWLHAEGLTGSHVVIRRKNRNDTVPENTIRLAAILAAVNCAAAGDDAVPVAVTQGKYVRKHKHDPAGRATYSQERVLAVTPDKDVVQQFSRPAEG